VLLEHILVEKERRRCNVAVCRKRRQEGLELRRPHFRGMTLAVKHDEAPDPRSVSLLGATTIVPCEERNMQAPPRGRGCPTQARGVIFVLDGSRITPMMTALSQDSQSARANASLDR